MRRKTAIEKATKLLKSFSGHKPKILGRMPFPKNPGTGIAIGKVLGVSYKTMRDGRVESYYHEFKLKDSRPLLVVTPDGKQLFLLGGAYDFTERGIEDRPRKR